MNNIWIITLFESYFRPLLETGVVGSALRGERGETPSLNFLNPSDFCEKGFKGVDDSPYGGGAGQIMKADVLEKTLLEGIPTFGEEYEVIYLSPRGETFSSQLAVELKERLITEKKNLIFICGRYEGVDERFLEKYVTRYLSLGEFILSGGEVALMPILDAIYRHIPNVLGNKLSPEDESFHEGLLEYPQYTKPQNACGKDVPEILLSGHHEKIKSWRDLKRQEMTQKFRPDLLKGDRR